MDVILDEVRKRDMKVWILDDSHFPTGFANGALKDAPLELHRQGVCVNRLHFMDSRQSVTLELAGLIPPSYEPVRVMEQFAWPGMIKGSPQI